MEGTRTLVEAINFACIKHKDQRRKDASATPYINHPVGVCHILMIEAGVQDTDVLAAAILHDTLEDTETSEGELSQVFGPAILKLVLEVTDDKSLTKDERKKRQISHAKEISDGGKLVKMADKLYNLRDLKRCVPDGWDLERVQQYFRWARMVVAGCKGVNSYLDQQLDLMTDPVKSQITFQGKNYPCFIDSTPTYC